MKRLLCAGLLFALSIFWCSGQSAEALEESKRLNANMEELQATLSQILRKQSQLESDLRRLEGEINRIKSTQAEEVKSVQEGFNEVRRKQQESSELVTRTLNDLKKELASTPAPPPPVKEKPPKPPAAPVIASDKVYVYEVVSGDTPSSIIKDFNENYLPTQGKTGRITLADVLAANPGLDSTRMKVKQKLNLPIPNK